MKTAFWPWSSPRLRRAKSFCSFRASPRAAGGRRQADGFDWDEHTQRARLKIPAGKGPASHVRIGIAIEPPDATAFFDSARVLMIGETNRLTAQFSSDAIAQRSRLRLAPAFRPEQKPGKEPLGLIYQIKVPVDRSSTEIMPISQSKPTECR